MWCIYCIFIFQEALIEKRRQELIKEVEQRKKEKQVRISEDLANYYKLV